ncbi:TetR/AcrR family transcriptional regulator [Rhodococcus sp. NPDC003318]|uniref:TetR/AcrR family transcriptional regulator n=1 Tax=Rhodococcus sp. NPDC003318 TaxID=3364503 RepID=UPI0036776F07
MAQTQSSRGRTTLVHAAERLVAEKGLHGVRASEVVKAAGHRNNSAVAYHFGSWDNLLIAVWELHTAPTNAARAAFLAEARTRGPLDLPTMVRAYIDPLVGEIARNRPSYWARFSEQWLATVRLDFFDLDAESAAAQPHTESVLALHSLFTDLADALTQLPPGARTRRVALMSRFVIATLAAWEREDEPPQSLEDLRSELVSTAVALLQAP